MKKTYLYILAGLLTFSSCNDWLDVDPKTSIPADKEFETEYGFKDALTGIYLKLTDTELYARNLTYGYLDELAGIYEDHSLSNDADRTDIYDYTDEAESRINGIYVKMYNTIANVNNLLTNLEEHRNVLTTPLYYETMKGEALGLRAFLHFDLLRLYGPIFSENPNGEAIPYRTTFDNEATPVLSASDVVEKILADLTQAHDLLADSDPCDFFTDRTSEEFSDKNMFLVDRQFRMNLYAVKAMLARVYSYKGDAESRRLAVQYAQEVIDATDYFTLYTTQDVNTYNSIRYREQVFGISVYDLENILENNNMSMASEPSIQYRYVTPRANFQAFYDLNSGGDTDWRSHGFAFNSVETYEGMFMYCLKYNQANLSTNADGADAIPLIRLPEMYYIIAECADDPQTSADALNEVRFARGISYEDEINTVDYDRPYAAGEDPSLSKRVNLIMHELRKEYFAEGQLFFYLKAHHFTTFDGCLFENGMQTEHYQWVLPEDEIIFGNNNKQQ